MSTTRPGDSSRRPRAGQEVRQRPSLAVETAWAVVGVGALIGLTLWGEYQAQPATSLFTVDVATAALSCCLLPVMLRWPVPGTVALAILSAVSPTATPAATLGALRVAQRRRFGTAAGVAATGIAAQLIRELWRPLSGLSFAWWALLVVAAYAALVGWGAWNQARQSLVASLRERARAAEAEQSRRIAEARMAERTRIAREMHDVLAHRLSLVATYAGALEYRPDAPPGQLASAAGVIRASVHEALGELRDVIAVLRDTESAEDIGEHPQPVLADLPGLFEEASSAGTPIQLDNRLASAAGPPAAVGRTAYRVVQEALTNARKHAAGQPVRVILSGTAGTRLEIEISNPVPTGPAAVPVAPGAGTGLVGLSERVHLAGGQFDHRLAVGEFRVQAWLPWPA
jgi:signal transduction histidine kinase